MSKKFLLLAISGKERLFVKKSCIIFCFMLRNIFFHKTLLERTPTITVSKRETPVCKTWCFESIISRHRKNHQPNKHVRSSRCVRKMHCDYDIYIRQKTWRQLTAHLSLVPDVWLYPLLIFISYQKYITFPII